MSLCSPSLSVSLSSAVRVTRAPTGTKATPTASLSVCFSTCIHNVHAQSLWCQLEQKDHISADQDHLRLTPQINSGGLHFSDHYGFYRLSERPMKCLQWWADRWQQSCLPDEAFNSAPDLKWTKTEEHFGGWKRGMWGELLREQTWWFRHLLQCHCEDPGSLEQPTGASPFHVELRGFRENLITSTVSLCERESVCVCVSLCECVCVSGCFHSSGTVVVFCSTI